MPNNGPVPQPYVQTGVTQPYVQAPKPLSPASIIGILLGCIVIVLICVMIAKFVKTFNSFKDFLAKMVLQQGNGGSPTNPLSGEKPPLDAKAVITLSNLDTYLLSALNSPDIGATSADDDNIITPYNIQFELDYLLKGNPARPVPENKEARGGILKSDFLKAITDLL